jgi:hypothetical protein
MIMNALPMEYRAVLAAELRNRERALALDAVEDCLENYQPQVHPYEDDSSNGRKSGKIAEQKLLSSVLLALQEESAGSVVSRVIRKRTVRN